MDKLISIYLKNWAALRCPPSNGYKKILVGTSMVEEPALLCYFWPTKFMIGNQQKFTPIVGVWGLRPFCASQIWSYHMMIN